MSNSVVMSDLNIRHEICVLGHDPFILASLVKVMFVKSMEEDTTIVIVIRVKIVLSGLLFSPLMLICNAISDTEDLLVETNVIKKYVNAPITNVPRRLVKASATGTGEPIAFSTIIMQVIFEEGLVKENKTISEAKRKILIMSLSLFLAGSSKMKFDISEATP